MTFGPALNGEAAVNPMRRAVHSKWVGEGAAFGPPFSFVGFMRLPLSLRGNWQYGLVRSLYHSRRVIWCLPARAGRLAPRLAASGAGKLFQVADEAAIRVFIAAGPGHSDGLLASFHSLALAPMIGITISAEAYAAIKATFAAGTQTWPISPADQGDVIICLDQATVDRLGAMRGPGESYSDVILRLANATRLGL